MGKSFNAFFDAKNRRNIDIDDLIVYKCMSLDEAQKQVGSFWSYLYPKKEDIQNQLIDVDKLLPKIDEKKASKILEFVKSIEDGTNEGAKSFQELYDTGNRAKQWIAEYGQSTKDQIRSTEGVIKANQQARASALAHNEAIKAQTFSAKAGKVALQALAMAGNMIAIWAIGKFIGWVDNLIHSSEHCKERVDELISSYQSAIDKANNNAKAVEDLAARYETLYKGVNNLGENVSLAKDEYREYNKIVNQIADMFPTLVQGYTNEGNAILSLKGNVEQLRDAYKKAQQEAYNLLITSGKDSDGNDIIKNWTNITNGTFWQESTTEKIDYLDELSKVLESKEELEKYRNILVNSSGIIVSWFHDFTGLVANFNIDDLSDDDLSAIRKNVQALKQTYQAEIDSALKNVQTLANAYLMTNENYDALDEQAKNAASIIVNSLNEGIVSGFKSKEDVGAYVIGIVESIKNNPGIQDTLVSLFSTDFSEKPVNEAKELIDLYIKKIAETIGENEFELKVRLGFNDIVDTANRLSNSIRLITDDHGISDREEYTTLSEYTKDFTQAQVELWLEATLGADDATQAIELYKAKFAEINANAEPISFSGIFSLKSADNTLTNLGKISESIDTIQNAYKTLSDAIDEYNEEGAFSVDTLQSIIALGDNWLDYLVDEDGALKLDKESLEQLTQARLNDMRIQAINNVIDNVSKIESDAQANNYLKTTNYALAESYEEVAEKALESARAKMQDAVAAGTLSQANMDAAMKKAQTDIAKINKLFANTGINTKSITAKSGKSSSNSSSTNDFEEQFDFFERRVKVLDNAVSLLKANLENLTGSFAKNRLLDQNSNILEERIRNYSDAAKMYQEKALESLSKLDLETRNKIISGSVSLNDYIGEDSKAVIEAMNDYKGWADKVADCTEELANLQAQLRQLELDKFNHIVQDFTDQFDLRDNAKGLIDKQISLFEEAGQLVGKAFYEEQIGQTQKQLSLLENEKAQLVSQLNSALGSGKIQKGTEEWLEMVNALSDVDGNILDCKKSIEQFNNAIQGLHWEVFDRVQGTFGNISDEISNLLDLMKNSEVATPDNQWTDEGLTQLGLYAQQYELATYQVSQYADEIDRLNADYLIGKYSATEYADKLADLNSAQWKAVNAAESAKDSILDLNEARVSVVADGIQKEIDAYKELIDSQIEALDAEKDLHEYQNSIAEKSGNIAKLERQLAAMQNDNTAATVAKRKQLEEQLAEARANLDETQYEHSVASQKESLNQQYENYENARNQEIESLEESLKDRENIIAVSMESVKQNTQIIAGQITEIANQHGIKVSSALTNSWASGENAIASYGEVLSQGTSAFIGNIMAVESQIYQLQADADITAVSLANMFGTNADNLVNQLNSSYFAEVNLLNMTNALQSSLISTLQGEYNVSNILNSLNAITNAARIAKGALETPLQPISSPTKPDETAKSLPGMTAAIAAGNGGILRKYASGTHNITKRQLAITNESGQEFIYRAKDGSILTRLQPGDKVFNNAAVERLYQLGQGLVPADITPHMEIPQLNNIKKAEGTVNMNYDHLIEINGDVNDTNHFIKQISTVAEQAITNAVKTAEKTRKYGMF